MLNFLIAVFVSSLVGVLGICYFFLNTELEEKEASDKQKMKGEKLQQQVSTTQQDTVSQRNDSKITSFEERKNISPGNERCLCDKIVKLLKEAEDKDIKIKSLKMKLEQEKLKSQDHIKEKLGEVISQFEPKIEQLFANSAEKLDRLMAINEELYQSNKRQTKQEDEMLRVRDEMMKKIDMVMKSLAQNQSRQIPSENQEVEELKTSFFTT